MSGPFELRLRPHKVGSVCVPFDLGPYVTVHQQPVAEEGAAVACRVLTARKEYGHLELPSGRQARLVPGDIIVGVLGNRAALRGFCGRVPTSLALGDRLQLLNMGGVIGVAEGAHAGLGSPIELEVLGTPMRSGRILRLSEHGIDPALAMPERIPPVLVLVGTCMNAGKTTAAAVITRDVRRRGRMVHAGKVTGVAAIKDLQLFEDNGASRVLSFLDCGLPSTCYRSDVVQVSHTLLAHLAREAPDLIILEMGDGLMGEYGVDDVLADPVFSRHVRGAVLAAQDIIGAVAAAERLRAFGIEVKVVTGPCTDNTAGTRRLASMGLRAANTLMEPDEVCRLALSGLLPAEES
ncbi:MAG TPA: hypothetical protein PKA64_14960 [Myxococcota bacterium]|nr:hypothetical protein [Myxococcota bacterium]